MKALRTQIVKDYKACIDDAKILEEQIHNKIDGIIISIHKAFHVPYPDSWYFEDDEGDVFGAMNLEEDDINYNYYFQPPDAGSMYADDYNYYGGFPHGFLFLSSKKIEQIVAAAIEKQKGINAQKKLKEKSRIDGLKEIKREALKKLTKKEKEALGVS